MKLSTLIIIVSSLFVSSFLVGCKQDVKTQSENSGTVKEAATTAQAAAAKDRTARVLPDPCSAVDKTDIAKLLGKSTDMITHKNGGSPSSTTRSCFYRWSDSKIPNAAILLQALGNPVPDEFSGWASAFIENKKSNGERLLSDPDTPIKYVTLQGVGEHSCYNLKESKCYYRVGDVVYLVATNGIDDEEIKMDIFKTLGKKILAGS